MPMTRQKAAEMLWLARRHIARSGFVGARTYRIVGTRLDVELFH